VNVEGEFSQASDIQNQTSSGETSQATEQVQDTTPPLTPPTSPEEHTPISGSLYTPSPTSTNSGNEDGEKIEVIPRRTRAASGIIKPLKYNPSFILSVQASKIPIPKSPKHALQIPEWQQAMKEEYEALMRNETWQLIPRSMEDNIINTKWIFRVKSKDDGTVERYKARLVANGMRQIEGSDYTHTFSPVIKANSVRIVLTFNNGYI